MTVFISTIMKTSLKLRLLTQLKDFNITSVNHLYSSSALGIDNYLSSRKRIKEQFANHTDKFKMKMNQFVEDPRNLIFTEDLKNMVHIAEPSDVGLVTKMVKRFMSQKNEFRFGSFVFGPVVMRMFYFLDAPNEALKTFLHPDINGFFDQLVSFQILLDLLYNHQMYDEMYTVFEVVKEKQINMTKYPKYPVVLILAACYQQNTPKSFEYASKLWIDMTMVGNKPLRRAATFMAGLALKNNAPHVALEAISIQRQHYVTVRNIKAIALAQLNRPDDALNVLKSVLNIDDPNQKDKHTFFNDTLMIVNESVIRANNDDLVKEYKNIVDALMDRKLIDHQNLETLLNSEITLSPKTQDRNMRQRGSRLFNTRKEIIST